MGTLAVFLSGLSSLVIIGKVGVENFLDKHKDQVSKCSPQGKIVLACTALPVTLLVTIFKIGSLAVMHPGARAIVVFVGHALSGLTLLVLKLCRSRNDQELTSINQSIIAEILTLHIQPKGRQRSCSSSTPPRSSGTSLIRSSWPKSQVMCQWTRAILHSWSGGRKPLAGFKLLQPAFFN